MGLNDHSIIHQNIFKTLALWASRVWRESSMRKLPFSSVMCRADVERHYAEELFRFYLLFKWNRKNARISKLLDYIISSKIHKLFSKKVYSSDRKPNRNVSLFNPWQKFLEQAVRFAAYSTVKLCLNKNKTRFIYGTLLINYSQF